MFGMRFRDFSRFLMIFHDFRMFSELCQSHIPSPEQKLLFSLTGARPKNTSISALRRSCGSRRSLGKSGTSPGTDLEHSRGRGDLPGPLSKKLLFFSKSYLFFVHFDHLARPEVPRFVDPLCTTSNNSFYVAQMMQTINATRVAEYHDNSIRHALG